MGGRGALSLLLLRLSAAALLAKYDLDGDAADSSGNGLDGAVVAAGDADPWGAWCPACDSPAYLDSTMGAYVSLPTDTALDQLAAWTVVFSVFHSDRSAAQQSLLEQYNTTDPGSYRNQIFLDVDGCVYLDQQPEPGLTVSTGETCVPVDQWTTLGVSLSDDTVTFTLAATGATSTQSFETPVAGTDAVALGRGFGGLVNALYVYSGALSADALANLDSATAVPGAAACCPTIETAQGAESVTVTIATATAAGWLAYSTDGSTPHCGAAQVESDGPEAALTTTADMTVSAVACADGLDESELVSLDVSGSYVVATPTFSTDGDSDTGVTTLEVTVSTTTSGAAIWTSTAGAPAACGEGEGVEGAVVELSASGTVWAIACRDGYADSAVAQSPDFFVQADQPRFAVDAYGDGVTNVTVYSATPGVDIRYSVDGSAPSCADSALAEGGVVSLVSNAHVKALACGDSLLDSWVSISPLFTVQAASPVFAVVSGGVTSLTVALSTASPNCEVRWASTSSEALDCSSGTVGSSVTLTQSATLWAIACGDDNTDSAVVQSDAFEVVAAAPELYIAADAAQATLNVSITTGTALAALAFTTDGSDPACPAASTKSHVFIAVPRDDTVKAVACGGGLVSDSDAVQSQFTSRRAAAPVFTDGDAAPGEYFTVDISTASGGAHLRYTVDGSLPACGRAGTLVDAQTAAVVLHADARIRAVACHSTWNSSAVVTSHTYEVGAKAPSVAWDGAALRVAAPANGTSVRYTTTESVEPSCDGAVGAVVDFGAPVELAMAAGDVVTVVSCYSLVASAVTAWRAVAASGVWVDVDAPPVAFLATPLYNATVAAAGGFSFVYVDSDDGGAPNVAVAGVPGDRTCSLTLDGAAAGVYEAVTLAVSCSTTSSSGVAAQLTTSVDLTLQDETSSVASGLGAFFAYAALGAFFVYRWRARRNTRVNGFARLDEGKPQRQRQPQPHQQEQQKQQQKQDREALHEAFWVLDRDRTGRVDVDEVMWLHMTMGRASTVPGCRALLQAASGSDSAVADVERREFVDYLASSAAQPEQRALFVEAGLLSLERKELLRHFFHWIDGEARGSVDLAALELALFRFGASVGPAFSQRKATALADRVSALAGGQDITLGPFMLAFQELADVRDDRAFNDRLSLYLADKHAQTGFLESDYTRRTAALQLAFAAMDSSHYRSVSADQVQLLARFLPAPLELQGQGQDQEQQDNVDYDALETALVTSLRHVQDTGAVVDALAGFVRVQRLPLGRRENLLAAFTHLDEQDRGVVARVRAERFVERLRSGGGDSSGSELDVDEVELDVDAVEAGGGEVLNLEQFLAFTARRTAALDEEAFYNAIGRWRQRMHMLRQRWREPTDFSLEILGQAKSLNESTTRAELLLQAFAASDDAQAGYLSVEAVTRFGRFMTARWTESAVQRAFAGRRLVGFEQFAEFCGMELAHLSDVRFASLVLGYLEALQLGDDVLDAFARVFQSLDADSDGLVAADEMFNFCRYVVTHNQLELAVGERPFRAGITLEEFVAFCATYTKLVDRGVLLRSVGQFMEYAF